jgi:hypothetical protein
MGTLSSRLTKITFGTTGSRPSLSKVTINNTTGSVTGPVPSNAASAEGIMVDGDLIADRVWNAVWNDLADYQPLNDELVFGKCYYDTLEGARLCTERCQKSVIGIASDSFGFAVGVNDFRQVPIAIAGWVLAYVDKEYEPGTPLTNNEQGILTEMTKEEKSEFPERIVGIYKRKEYQEKWGPAEESMVEVDGRHWVKVKS